MAAAALEKGGQEEDDSDHRRDAADSSSFKLLNELGDLLMLPTDMLLGNIMKEICPYIDLPLLQVCNFTPDEFCPEQVPGMTLLRYC
ncbi:hypothetical protein E2562_000784 [Oryza meyeriana var. granulata]|uniref:Uncharacterized protein n=1 Tax=Oryza meyeriana var. granulata TaxID=110450 RepID=A0A6G1DVF8_9ORYZ|nr:hypothetical protein E2562_000784 [Oryza meyeriana var. granulata]